MTYHLDLYDHAGDPGHHLFGSFALPQEHLHFFHHRPLPAPLPPVTWNQQQLQLVRQELQNRLLQERV